MAAGGAGVMDGTAYLAADEADVHPVYRNELVAARGSDTRLTTLFDVGWPKAPHGVLRNPTFEAWQAAGSPPPGERPGENQTVATRAGQSIVRYSDAQPTRDTTGDIRAMALYAGTGVEHIHHDDAAATITARLLAATSTSK
jgi:NAD(P)H-dependent flavin oxidoreductase YrpB (nitropropane dioxygenase family)